MTEKRYFLHKHLIKNDVIHDRICHRWLKGEELESDMNTLYYKYSSLKRENEQLKIKLEDIALENENAKESNDDAQYELYKLKKENEQLKQSNERIIKDIDLALGFIRHKGYSLQDIKDYEDAKKEYEEDLAYYRKGDVE